MKKVYQITKFVVAESIEEALTLEKDGQVEEIFLTKHSMDLLLDTLHTKKEKI